MNACMYIKKNSLVFGTVHPKMMVSWSADAWYTGTIESRTVIQMQILYHDSTMALNGYWSIRWGS